MKKNKYFVFAIIITALIYSGCESNFLDIQPKESISIDGLFESERDVRSAINAAYGSLQNRGMYSDRYMQIVDAPSDEHIRVGGAHRSLETFTWGTNVNFFDTPWETMYEGIFRSNMVLQNVPEVEMDQSEKERILGEARFLRALYYWHLVASFGEVPLVTEANPNDPSAAAVPKSSTSDIIDQIIIDLTEAINVLPVLYESENVGRATSGAAKALLGKIYLYSTSPLFGGNNDNYTMAANLFKEVINSGQYQLVDYVDIWVEDNNEEYIFEVQYNDIGGNNWALEDGPGLNENSIRAALYLPDGRGGNANHVVDPIVVDAFESYNGPDPDNVFRNRDPRLYYNIWRDGDYFDPIEPVYESSWSETGFNIKKGFAFPFTDRNEDGYFRNTPIIRLGDVLLMYAEAVNAKSSREPQEAIDAINKIRERVNMPTYPNPESPFSVDANSSKQEIFEAIVHERRVELYSEMHRYHDLKRWELAEEVLGENGFQYPKHNFFPIPAQEVQNNDQLEQNPNY